MDPYSSMWSITCIFIKTIWTLIKFCAGPVEAETIKKSRYAIASLQMEFYVFCSSDPDPVRAILLPTDKIMKKYSRPSDGPGSGGSEKIN